MLFLTLDVPLLLSFYEIKLALLVTISQSRVGAVHVMNAGLFPAIRASGLFSVDPDIGVGKFHRAMYLEHTDMSRNRQSGGASQVLQATAVDSSRYHISRAQ